MFNFKLTWSVRAPVPTMTDTYKAANRNVAVIIFREWTKGR